MATYKITANTTSGLNTLADDDKWIIEAGVSVDVIDDNAFYGVRSFTNNNLSILGSVQSTGDFVACLMKAAESWITVGASGSVTSERNAIEFRGAHATLINRGSIDAVDFGARFIGSDAFIKNEGTISSDNTGLNVSGAKNEIENYGTIEGLVGVSVGNSARGTLDFYNEGTVSGTKYAYVGGDTRENVLNAGQIVGDVYMRNGEDVFVSDGGSVTGSIYGGNGNDLYYLDSSSLSIVEQDQGGVDHVYSSVSYVLGDFVEDLNLSGADPINGRGNVLANSIIGNASNNVINGLGGRDTLSGGKGNDNILGGAGHDVITGSQGRDTLTGGGGGDGLSGGGGKDSIYGRVGFDRISGGRGDDNLFGGGGADTFVFANGHGIDIINDFLVNGSRHDVIDLSRISGISGFHDLLVHHMTQVGSDVVISDATSRITVKDTDINALTAGDFLF